MALAQKEIQAVNDKGLDAFIKDYVTSNSWTHWKDPKTSNSYTCSILTASSLTRFDFDACFNLIAQTSALDYKNSRDGWKPRSKKKEMKSIDLKYILVREVAETPDDEEGIVKAFLSFMPTIEDDYPVVYCYEIHCAPELQGTGLGTMLMDLLDVIAARIKIAEKLMLSCFVRNIRAVQFYRKRGYNVDECSPEPRILRSGEEKAADYLIMSKSIARRSKET